MARGLYAQATRELEESMSWNTHRPRGRFFNGQKLEVMVWLLAAPLSWMMWLAVGVVQIAHAQTGPATTLVSDTVYRADSSPAQGVLLISWPPFTTATGVPVAAGNTSTPLGAGGALAVNLVANVSATPANTYYSVVYQLDDGTVRTEYWLVPTTSPANLATVRATPGSGTTAQLASQQYVNAALAAKASDDAVVHIAGAETIAGTKQFAVPPSVPAPAASADAANKAYVDSAVAAVGAGAYVAKTGDTMSGPLLLSAEHSDIRRSVYDRLVNAAIAVAISAAIALHDHLGLK
jgi:hypothetical protein